MKDILNRGSSGMVIWVGDNNLLYGITQAGITAAIVVAVLFILRKVLRKHYPARAMCFVWAVLALRLLIPVQLTLPKPAVTVTPRTNYILYMRSDPVMVHDSGTVPESRWVSNEDAVEIRKIEEAPVTTFDVGELIFAVWAAGAALYLLWQTLCYRRFLGALSTSRRGTGNQMLLDALERQKNDLGIKRDVPLYVSPAAECPMLAGFLKPCLYLSDEELMEEDADFVFRHELTHYKNKDLWVKLLLMLSRSVQWFNPVVHLMARLAQEDIELACDAEVVRNMGAEERRAYGETILRSVTVKAKRPDMVSCFTGDKEGLMRRFEGLFNKKAKKSVVALVAVAAVTATCMGAAFSINSANGKLKDEDKLALAADWAKGESYGRYAVKLEGEGGWLISEQKRDDGTTYRAAQKLEFSGDGTDMMVLVDPLDSETTVTKADTLEHFKLLFENELGAPELTYAIIESWNVPEDAETTDSDYYVISRLYQLSWKSMVREPAENGGEAKKDMEICHVVLKDNSSIKFTLVGGSSKKQLPQDWTYNEGKNGRTPSDLTAQFARGVRDKSGQYVYPILSEDLKKEFIEYQKHGGGEWYWKLGGSSPSYRDFVIVPTESENVLTVVFQRYGGGVPDDRSAYNVIAGKENGRSVITGVDEVVPDKSYTYSDIFRLYYNTGLAWPDMDSCETENGKPSESLRTPVSAAYTVFAYFGREITYETENGSNTEFKSWFTVDEAYTRTFDNGDAVVCVRFPMDGSEPVYVRLHKNESGYYFPVGLWAERHIEAYALTGNPDSRTELFVADTAAEAVKQGVPDIPFGAEIVFSFEREAEFAEYAVTDFGEAPSVRNLPLVPADEKPAVERLKADGAVVSELPNAPLERETVPEKVTISDAMIRSDGSMMFDDKVTEVTELEVGDGKARYTIESNPAAALRSTYDPNDNGQLRAITVNYELYGKAYTAVTVINVGNSAPGGWNVRLQSDNKYTDNYYGYTLTLPESFIHRGYSRSDGHGNLSFGLAGAMPDQEGFGEDGNIMSMNVMPTVILKENNGEDWESNYVVPCKKLAERNGMSYFLTFASDVQYDTSDAEISKTYNEMYQDAQKMDGSAIEFLPTGNDDFLMHETEARLTALGYRRANVYMEERGAVKANNPDAAVPLNVAVLPDAENLSCDIVYSMYSQGGCMEFRNVERAKFSETGIEPLSVEQYASSADKGTTLEKFMLFYRNAMGLPVYDEDAIRRLQDMQLKGEDDLSTPEKGSLRYGMSEAYATLKGVEDTADDKARVTYEFWDTKDPSRMKPSGETVTLEMKKFQPDAGKPAVWLADAFEVGFSDGTTIIYGPPKTEENGIPQFSDKEIKDAYKAVEQYAEEHGFTVENFSYNEADSRALSSGIMENGVLRDNEGLSIEDVISVKGDAYFSGPDAVTPKCEGWSFTLYRGADRKWILEDGAFGY